jgi:hypothetical protein
VKVHTVTCLHTFHLHYVQHVPKVTQHKVKCHVYYTY